jgi:hypothetical protein
MVLLLLLNVYFNDLFISAFLRRFWEQEYHVSFNQLKGELPLTLLKGRLPFIPINLLAGSIFCNIIG